VLDGREVRVPAGQECAPDGGTGWRDLGRQIGADGFNSSGCRRVMAATAGSGSKLARAVSNVMGDTPCASASGRSEAMKDRNAAADGTDDIAASAAPAPREMNIAMAAIATSRAVAPVGSKRA